MKKRYIIYLSLLGLIALQFFLIPALPVIQLPGEVIYQWPGGSEFLGGWFSSGITNTFVGSLLAVLILLILTLVLRARSRTAEEVPTGFYNFFEMIIEMAYGYVENAAGKWAKAFFPFFMTFILWIVIANWIELIPGVDSIGKWETSAELALHEAEVEAGHDLEGEEAELVEEEALAENSLGLRSWPFLLSKNQADESAPLGEEIDHVATGKNPEAADWTIVPYVRAAATDLNFTLAIAFISVIMTQYYGMKAQGMKYWLKFFPFYKGKGDEIAQNPLGVMDIGVGLLEFISEIFKIVSFAFRLLGNIFAGQVLLFVIGSLLPIANLLFWHLEFGVGLLQGVVLALLTLTFMKAATESHHGEAH
jgi:F-type H+-transporting ATPase subunit a